MKRKFPEFKSDAEAEAFVDTADLSEYDFSDMTPVRFELRPKDDRSGASRDKAERPQYDRAWTIVRS